MIFLTALHATPPIVTATMHVEQTATARTVFNTMQEGEAAFNFELNTPAGNLGAAQAKAVEIQEEFDWRQVKVLRQYIRLEQKVLADKADAEEIQRYKVMKADRNSEIFADRYVTDYAEIQRLKILTEKLADIQQYLRPIKTG